MDNPYVAVRVGEEGDIGSMEIQDMMFTAKGATAGVILMEWNVAQSVPGEAAMWGKIFFLEARGRPISSYEFPRLTCVPANDDLTACR
jgi:hypothetical protein